MSVTIKLFSKGKVTTEKIFAGKSIDPVVEYLNDNEIQYRVKDSEIARELTSSKDITIICVDDTNVLGPESMANFITEYLFEYDEAVYNDLIKLLN